MQSQLKSMSLIKARNKLVRLIKREYKLSNRIMNVLRFDYLKITAPLPLILYEQDFVFENDQTNQMKAK